MPTIHIGRMRRIRFSLLSGCLISRDQESAAAPMKDDLWGNQRQTYAAPRTVSTLRSAVTLSIISAEIPPMTNTDNQRSCAPNFASAVVPAHGATANARLNATEYAPMYSPLLCAGAISATYADACGKSIISPNVHTTIAAITMPGPFASASAPDPTAKRNAPSERARA